MKFNRKNKGVDYDLVKMRDELNKILKLEIKTILITSDYFEITAGTDPNPEEMGIIESYIRNNNI